MFTRLSHIRSFLLLASLLLLTGIVSLASSAPASAASCLVPSTAYPTIQSAVDDPGCNPINIDNGEFKEDLLINRSLEIDGNSMSTSIIHGAGQGPVITVTAPDVTISNLTITGGANSQNGGGISNQGANVTITHCKITENQAKLGGGIHTGREQITINNSTISHNRAASGGGMFIDGPAEINNSAIIGNRSIGTGGIGSTIYGDAILNQLDIAENIGNKSRAAAIYNTGKMVINNSSVHHNIGNVRGVTIIDNSRGTLSINNSTISNNKTIRTTVVNINATTYIASSTIARNDGSPALESDRYTNLSNTIIGQNNGDDCAGYIDSNGYNLVENPGKYCDFQKAEGDKIFSVVYLGDLMGHPPYHPLTPGPGINNGNPDGCFTYFGELLDTDQRGMPRAGRCDIGAYEYQGEFHQIFLPLSLRNFCPDFYDNFSYPTSGWSVIDNPYLISGYNEGEFQVRTKNDKYIYLFAAPNCDRDNYLVGVDARWAGQPGAAYGLIFNIKGSFNEYYLFFVNSEYGVYWLDYYGPAGRRSVIRLTESARIKPDSAINHLQVMRYEDRISLYVNGTKINQVTDKHITGNGGSGFFTVPYENHGDTDARIDNFFFRALSGSTSAASSNRSTTMNHQLLDANIAERLEQYRLDKK